MFTKREMVIFMNKHESDILELLLKDSKLTQRQISERISFKQQSHNKLINLSEKTSPKSAVILAAGSGMRMVPINVETSKGILRVKGEVLIERLIKQLHEVGISDIVVIVGFMKEKYEYLIDKFNVQLIVNSKYSEKNNLYSVKLAEKNLLIAISSLAIFILKKILFQKSSFLLGTWFQIAKPMNLLTGPTENMNW